MLDKALQQPEGKISEQVLYTEEEVKQLTMTAMPHTIKWVRLYMRDESTDLDHEEWWAKHKKH